jgi:hypothetical protein
MKTLRKLFATVVLTLAMTVSSFSGEISVPGARIQSSQHSIGEISFIGARSTTETITSETTIEVAAFDPVTESMLSLLQSFLLIF